MNDLPLTYTVYKQERGKENIACFKWTSVVKQDFYVTQLALPSHAFFNFIFTRTFFALSLLFSNV